MHNSVNILNCTFKNGTFKDVTSNAIHFFTTIKKKTHKTVKTYNMTKEESIRKENEFLKSSQNEQLWKRF